MSQASNYLENKIVDHVLGTATFTKPTNVYLALFLSDPTDAASGTEVTGGGYVRQVITFNAASGGSASSAALVTFTASGSDFGTVTHWAVYDASTSGNMLCYGALDSTRIIASGESLGFPIGSIIVTQS